jgi:hypothetical protein
VSVDSVSEYFDAIDTDAPDKGDAGGKGNDDRETDTSDGAAEVDSVPGFADESETDVSGDEDTTIESDAGSVHDTEMD